MVYPIIPMLATEPISNNTLDPLSQAELQDQLQSILQQQRTFFATGKTRDLAFRLTQLTKLRDAVIEY